MANHRYPKIRLNASVPGAAAAVVEEVAGDWLKRILGLPTTASFALASGCQMAHATCLVYCPANNWTIRLNSRIMGHASFSNCPGGF
jgi:hypothetical protein